MPVTKVALFQVRMFFSGNAHHLQLPRVNCVDAVCVSVIMMYATQLRNRKRGCDNPLCYRINVSTASSSSVVIAVVIVAVVVQNQC